LIRLWTEDGSLLDGAVDAIGVVPLPGTSSGLTGGRS
jgi:hypothetical protein